MENLSIAYDSQSQINLLHCPNWLVLCYTREKQRRIRTPALLHIGVGIQVTSNPNAEVEIGIKVPGTPDAGLSVRIRIHRNPDAGVRVVVVRILDTKGGVRFGDN